MLIISDPSKIILEDLNIDSISINDSSSFLKNIANQLFTQEQLDLCWYPASERYREPVHDLFNEAYNFVAEGQDFTETVFGKLILRVLPTCQEVAIWYSDNFQDLPSSNDEKEFVKLISYEMQKGLGETYLRFKQ